MYNQRIEDFQKRKLPRCIPGSNLATFLNGHSTISRVTSCASKPWATAPETKVNFLVTQKLGEVRTIQHFGGCFIGPLFFERCVAPHLIRASKQISHQLGPEHPGLKTVCPE